jgi:hypothetical protein
MERVVMKKSRHFRGMVRHLVSIGLLAGMLAVTTAPTTAAQAPTSTMLTYHFTDCSGPAGTPTTFDGVKQPGGAAALHVVDGSGIFIAVQAIDVASGTILFTTPGFEQNDLPTVTCQLVHPVTLRLQAVIGLLVPVTN